MNLKTAVFGRVELVVFFCLFKVCLDSSNKWCVWRIVLLFASCAI